MLGDNDRLVSLGSQLWQEYNLIVSQEELYWLHQAKCKWLTQGDNNTTFFHQYSLIRRRKNRITALINYKGDWIFDEQKLQDIVIEFYHNLYSSAGLMAPNFQTRVSFPSIKDGDLAMIRGPITLAETKSALFSMKNLKAPGPDGYHPIFFKSQWHIVGPSLYRFICDCFQQPNLIHEVNSALITLISKCDDPSKVSQFRPIALYNVVYKVITKIIAQRLRVIMPYMVSENQSSFIPGRSTVDNIPVLQELIHSFKQLKGKKGL